MGVKTIQLTENKGALAGALVVREHQELVFISQNGMVQRTSVRGISRYGRASQGVKVMNIRDDDQVSAVALVAESEGDDADVGVDDAAVPGAADGGSSELAAEYGDAEVDAPDSDPAPASDPGVGDGDGGVIAIDPDAAEPDSSSFEDPDAD